MVYKDFFLRTFFSIFLLIIYISICIYNTNYLFYLIIFIYLLIFFEVSYFFNKNKILIYFYLSISLFSISNIDFTFSNLNYFNLMIVAIISFDIFSYLVGSKFGKYKILKKISPNKTLEGLMGGIFFSFITSFAFLKIVNIEFNVFFITIIFIFLITAFLGDVIQSKFKRMSNIKNSSNFLPGHGGFFDRFDSFILSVIPYSVINFFYL